MNNRDILRLALRHDKGGLFAVLLIPFGLWIVGLFMEIV